LDLESKSDSEIWQYAKDNGFVIVSRDSDFQERSLVAGHPPQVIWLKIPNLLDHHQELVHALTEQQLACVELSHRNK
jgi:predicted nuclease of predicted toxin-antitoxin system